MEVRGLGFLHLTIQICTRFRSVFYAHCQPLTKCRSVDETMKCCKVLRSLFAPHKTPHLLLNHCTVCEDFNSLQNDTNSKHLVTEMRIKFQQNDFPPTRFVVVVNGSVLGHLSKILCLQPVEPGNDNSYLHYNLIQYICSDTSFVQEVQEQATNCSFAVLINFTTLPVPRFYGCQKCVLAHP